MVDSKERNPQRQLGFRNLECPYYMRCLDHAVRMSWRAFNCKLCVNQNLRKPLRASDLDLCAPGWEDIWAQTGWSSEPGSWDA